MTRFWDLVIKKKEVLYKGKKGKRMTEIVEEKHKREIEKALKQVSDLLVDQLTRVEKLKKAEDWIDYQSLKPLIIGIVPGDGIGPYICKQAEKVLRFLLKEEEVNRKVEFRIIEGLDIENRARHINPLPGNTFDEIKACHALLKGPLTTPSEGDTKWPNLESTTVTLRKRLDLFANIRPFEVPEKGINWAFFRENTEGEYVLGSKGVNVTEDLAIDFKVTTNQGAERIIRLAFEYAKKNGINRVTVVTKANVVKAGDGKFLKIAQQVAKDYPEVKWDASDRWSSRFIDIFLAEMIDPALGNQFKVIVLPNLYGDISTDLAAKMQGGIGTAGGANIGKRFIMTEAIHGSAPKMVDDGRIQYADPSSMIKATGMLLNHIGYIEKAANLRAALDICAREQKFAFTGRPGGATGEEFTDYLIEKLKEFQKK